MRHCEPILAEDFHPFVRDHRTKVRAAFRSCSPVSPGSYFDAVSGIVGFRTSTQHTRLTDGSPATGIPTATNTPHVIKFKS